MQLHASLDSWNGCELLTEFAREVEAYDSLISVSLDFEELLRRFFFFFVMLRLKPYRFEKKALPFRQFSIFCT